MQRNKKILILIIVFVVIFFVISITLLLLGREKRSERFDRKTANKVIQSLKYIRSFYNENNYFPSSKKFYDEFYSIKYLSDSDRPIIDYRTYWDETDTVTERQTFTMSYFANAYRDFFIGSGHEKCMALNICEKEYYIEVNDTNRWQKLLDKLDKLESN